MASSKQPDDFPHDFPYYFSETSTLLVQLKETRVSVYTIRRFSGAVLYEEIFSEASSKILQSLPLPLGNYYMKMPKNYDYSSGYRDSFRQGLAKAPHSVPSERPYVGDSSTKMRKDYACDKKPAGNQGEFSAAEKSEGKAESAGLEDKPIPWSQEGGSSPPAKVSHTSTQTEVPPDNEYEEYIRSREIPRGATGVIFDDIGGMDGIKKLLRDLVILPRESPDIFDCGLPEPCKGILLFGPPGTGKTMLAKAINSEARGSFINCSMSTLNSAWPGVTEKNVEALFTRAAKIAPTIIFIEDIDSMLGMSIIKNEFMQNWDGLMTKPRGQILVLATTSKPFSLDEPTIRRFDRKVMVGLPSEKDREEIFRIKLSKGKPDIDFKKLATMTEGYTGSDIKNLCDCAAYQPLRELLKKRPDLKAQKNENSEEGSQAKEDDTKKEERRPLTMKDMKEAMEQVRPSIPAEGMLMKELKRWKELHGDGGSGKEELTYFV